MKNTITMALVLICLGLAAFGQKPAGPARDVCYTIDFVFTGEIQNKGDSLFLLRYTFSAFDAGQFRQLELQDSGRGYSLSLSGTGPQGDMEIQKEKDLVRVLVHKYDRYDLPVLTLGEDSRGVKHPLSLKTNTGKLMTSEQLKAQIKGIRESEKQRREVIYNYQPRNKTKN